MVKLGLIVKTGIFFLVLFSFFYLRAQEPWQIDFQGDPQKKDFGRVAVNLPLDLSLEIKNPGDYLKVYVGTNPTSDTPPIVGNYWTENNLMFFIPKYPPPPGITYSIVFHARRLTEDYHLKDELPITFTKEAYVKDVTLIPETEVVTIYPSADTVPSNLLRIYLYFTNPMGSKDPFEYISLQSDDGVEIEDAFVEVPAGLWDRSRKRLTVLIHPGRVKRGIGPRDTMGPVFEKGKSYTLRISGNWEDDKGLPLVNTVEKIYRVTGADRKIVDPVNWTLTSPTIGTFQPLVVDFGEPLDHALINRMITVIDDQGLPVEGKIEAFQEESSISFIPIYHWKSGSYKLLINPKLEDLAGNNLISVFDLESGNSDQVSSGKSLATIQFKTIRK